jgi:sialic acid synthase SpsE
MNDITLPSGRKIGPGEPVFIVAEVGSNWRTLDDCLTSVVQAQKCGADAVKFQAYHWDALYGVSTQAPVSDIAGTLPLEWLPKLKAKADQVGIEFMCSAFGPELVDAVNPYVNIHKVASAELTHLRILERVRASGKPVILSTGASGEADIAKAIETLGSTPTVLLYCVAAYPARAIDLYQIHSLRGRFGVMAGYSDHSTDVETIPALAQSHGAVVIEKHVTFVDAETPDSLHSLTQDEFTRMVFAIRNEKYRPISTPPGIYSPLKGPTREEKPMIVRHNRRLIATRDIAADETLKEGENFGIYRSLKDETHAYSPWHIAWVSGRPAKRRVRAGDGIGPGDV